MLISRDGTKAFICVPKTGTNSVRHTLKQFTNAIEANRLGPGAWESTFTFFIKNYHNTLLGNLPNIRLQFPNATIESITAYGFLRDPVERWCSAVNFYYKREPWYLMGLKSVARNPRKMEILNHYSNLDRIHEDQFKTPSYEGNEGFIMNPSGLQLVKEFYSPDVVAEMAQTPWEEFPINLDEDVFFYPQAHWLSHPNTVILDYSKFKLELQWLVNEWGAMMFYEPADASSRNRSEVRKLPVSDSLRKRLMDAYSMDYDLTPHTIS